MYEFSSTSLSVSSTSLCVSFRVVVFNRVATTRRCFGPCVFLSLADAFRCKAAAGVVDVLGTGEVDKQYGWSSVSCGKASVGTPEFFRQFS